MLEPALFDVAGFDENQRELLEITWRLLNAIHAGDYETYAALSAPELSCYEDVCPYRLDGLEFHLDLIRLMAQNPHQRPVRFDLLTPRVQIYGDCGIVTYTRLITYKNENASPPHNASPYWVTSNETRVFVKRDGCWKMVHFHRSPTR